IASVLRTLRLCPPPIPRPSPYTTLFRSLPARGRRAAGPGGHGAASCATERAHHEFWRGRRRSFRGEHRRTWPGGPVQRDRRWVRSEEHTSELQSRFELVCRLLLEKKKTK